MNEIASTGVDMITGTLSGLPEPVKASFFKAVGDLLGGLTAIPGAKLRQYAQGIDDTTSARSAVAAAMAKVAADSARADPILIQAAMEVYLPTAVRKAKNRINVASSAAGHLNQKSFDNGSGGAARPPDDDWMNSFMRFAEDASSERLQDLFGRLLAGEIVRPGAFGLATLRALSELDQAAADDFNQAWSKSVGEEVDYSEEWRLGDYFARWKRLTEIGLMAATPIGRHPPPFNPIIDGKSLWSPIKAPGAWVNVWSAQATSTPWENIPFTRIGREIGSLLEVPDYENNVRLALNRFPKHGLARIDLHTPAIPVEVIWHATN